MLTTHFCLMPRSQKSGVIPPLSFMCLHGIDKDDLTVILCKEWSYVMWSCGFTDWINFGGG
jgi:hypothetical protein